jgi:hypothetical protein
MPWFLSTGSPGTLIACWWGTYLRVMETGQVIGAHVTRLSAFFFGKKINDTLNAICNRLANTSRPEKIDPF